MRNMHCILVEKVNFGDEKQREYYYKTAGTSSKVVSLN
jgi:hypothetical protein